MKFHDNERITDDALRRYVEKGVRSFYSGWMNYKDSPYKKYQETMESKEYGKNIRSTKSKENP